MSMSEKRDKRKQVLYSNKKVGDFTYEVREGKYRSGLEGSGVFDGVPEGRKVKRICLGSVDFTWVPLLSWCCCGKWSWALIVACWKMSKELVVIYLGQLLYACWCLNFERGGFFFLLELKEVRKELMWAIHVEKTKC